MVLHKGYGTDLEHKANYMAGHCARFFGFYYSSRCRNRIANPEFLVAGAVPDLFAGVARFGGNRSCERADSLQVLQTA